MTHASARNAFQQRELGCLAVLAVVLLIRFPLLYLRMRSPYFMDFNVFHFTAQLVTAGQGHDLYTKGYMEGVYFRYAPLWAILWSWLAAFSLHHAAVLWSALSVGWILLTLWLSGRIAQLVGLRYPSWSGIIVILLLVRELISEFSEGQADLWWGGLIVLWLYGELRGRRRLASLALALSMMLKLPSAIFLPYLVGTGRWRSFAYTLVWLVVLIPLGAYALEPAHPTHLLLSWAQSLAATSPGQAFTIGDQSLRALLGRLLTNDGYGLNLLSLSRPTVIVLSLIADVALLGLIALPRPSPRQPPLRLAMDVAMLLLLMVLASPAAWLATYTTALFPMFLACAAFTELIRTARFTPWAALCAGLVGVCSLLTNSKVWKTFGIYDWRTETYVFLVFLIPPWVALTLFGSLWLLRQRLSAAARAA